MPAPDRHGREGIRLTGAPSADVRMPSPAGKPIRTTTGCASVWSSRGARVTAYCQLTQPPLRIILVVYPVSERILE
jgi:hypothetical protein